MPVRIPEDIKRHIILVGKGRKLPKIKKEKIYSKEELLNKALKNLEFLNNVANSEPIHSFIKNNGIMVLPNFSTCFSYLDIPGFTSHDSLLLETIAGVTGLYYWLDADFPANRSDRDHQLITEEKLMGWSPKSIEVFSKVTRGVFWRNIREWLVATRKHLK